MSIELLFLLYAVGALVIICDGRLFDACIPVYRVNPLMANVLFLIFTALWPVTALMLLCRNPSKQLDHYIKLMDYARNNMTIDDQITAHNLFAQRQWDEFEGFVKSHKLKMKAKG